MNDTHVTTQIEFRWFLIDYSTNKSRLVSGLGLGRGSAEQRGSKGRM